MQYEILFTLHPIAILFWLLVISLSITIIFILYVMKFGGIGTVVYYFQRGGTIRIFRAKEDETSVYFGKQSFSKVVLEESTGNPVTYEDKEGVIKYKPAAQPATMWRRFRPYRAFYCQEGFPTILSWDRNVPVTDVTAEGLNALSRGSFAQGLANSLLARAKQSIWMVLLFILFGLMLGMLLYPVVFP